MNNFFIELGITRDSNGNITRETEYTYDENGNLTSIVSPLNSLSASNSTLTYDENNNLIRRSSFSLNNNFSTVFITDFTYDENGNLLTEIRGDFTGSDPGENPESITTYSYDDHDNLIFQSIDSNADGITNIEIEFTYDNNNNLLTQTNNQLNNDTSIIVKTYEYDENNNLISESEDINFDGVIDLTRTYEYDENNNLIVESTDLDLDGLADNITTNTYDENNNLITVEFESDSEFTEDSITTNTYDGNNNLITSTVDNNRDGTIETITENSYLQIGELNTGELDESNLSLTTVHRFYQYELGLHFYSADSNEIDSVRERSDLGELAYNYEAEQYQVLADNRDAITGEIIEEAKPGYRFLNTDTGAHFYTINETEKDSIQANLPNYNFEGIQYYVFESESENLDTIPVYRLFNNASGSHLYSSDTSEINYIVENLSNFVVENNGVPVFYVFEL